MKNSIHPTENFYDDIAEMYKYVYLDWEKVVADHARILDGLIRQHFPNNTRTILDTACGIGTQLIGLAELGYRMTGSDLSQKELDIAGEELRKRNIPADLHRCGFVDLPGCFGRMFDIVIAIDNAIPHLLSDVEILEAFKAMQRVCREGIMISVRDYDQVDKSKMQMIPYGYRRIDGKNWFLFQRWEFEGKIVSVSFFFVEEDDAGEITPLQGKVFRTEFYAIGVEKLMQLMENAGFNSTLCIENSFMQPVIIGKK